MKMDESPFTEPDPDLPVVPEAPADEEPADESAVPVNGVEGFESEAPADPEVEPEEVEPVEAAPEAAAPEPHDVVPVGAGGQHEAALDDEPEVFAPEGAADASEAPLVSPQGSESEAPAYAEGEYHAERIYKTDDEQVRDSGGNPVHPPDLAAQGLAEQRPGRRGRPGIDD